MMKTTTTTISAWLPALLLLGMITAGCAGTDTFEVKTRNSLALERTEEYRVRALEVTFQRPHAWDVDDTDWKEWVGTWQSDFREELRTECFKMLRFEGDGAEVTCTIYEMNRGEGSESSETGFVRAHVLVRDAQDKTLFDGKLQGTGANSGFESAITRGRLKQAILDLARQVARLLEKG